MNYLDYIILVIVLIGFLLGFKDGLVRKIIGLVGLIAGIGIAFEFSGTLGKLIMPFFNNDEYLASLIAGIIIFFLVIVITSIVKRIVHPLDKVNKLINQIMGGIIGIIQIAFFISAFFLFLNIFSFPANSDRQNSTLYNPTLNLIPNFIDIIIGHRSKATNFLKEYIEKQDSVLTPQIDSSNTKKK